MFMYNKFISDDRMVLRRGSGRSTARLSSETSRAAIS